MSLDATTAAALKPFVVFAAAGLAYAAAIDHPLLCLSALVTSTISAIGFAVATGTAIYVHEPGTTRFNLVLLKAVEVVLMGAAPFLFYKSSGVARAGTRFNAYMTAVLTINIGWTWLYEAVRNEAPDAASWLRSACALCLVLSLWVRGRSCAWQGMVTLTPRGSTLFHPVSGTWVAVYVTWNVLFILGTGKTTSILHNLTPLMTMAVEHAYDKPSHNRPRITSRFYYHRLLALSCYIAHEMWLGMVPGFRAAYEASAEMHHDAGLTWIAGTVFALATYDLVTACKPPRGGAAQKASASATITAAVLKSPLARDGCGMMSPLRVASA